MGTSIPDTFFFFPPTGSIIHCAKLANGRMRLKMLLFSDLVKINKSHEGKPTLYT